jgi:hypothetical protein
MFSRIPIGNLIIGLVAFVICVYEGCRQMHRAKHVEREGKIPPDMAARIRKKPMKLIGWGLILSGTFILLKEIFRF